MRWQGQAGFSAVELLITLFIATIFIFTGYQLYSAIIKSSSEARLRATASNIAYDNLRRYAGQATNPCTNVTPSPTPTVPSGMLPSSSITVTIDCPYGLGTIVARVTVSVKYGSPQQEVIHALTVNN